MINNIKFKNNLLIIFFGIFLTLPFIGIILNYSPIPEADFWSIFDRVYRLNQKDWSTILDQHNEHRPALSYLISYCDYKFFGGNFYLNYLITIISYLLSGYLFYLIFADTVKIDFTNRVYFSVILCLLFFWSQKPNFIFPFHISILWVNLFSLLVLFFYNRFIVFKKNIYLFLSLLISFLPILSMVSGIFTLPVLSLFALAKKRKIEFVLFLFMSIIVCYLYFYNFKLVSAHSNFLEINFEKFLNIYLYFFGYLGSIFSFMFGKGHFGLTIAIIFGHIFFVLFLWKSWKLILNKFNSNSDYLVFFILLVLINGLLTALGRFEDGILHSISSRYTTNTIFGWSILMILYRSNFIKFFLIIDNKNKIKKYKFLFFFLLVLMLHNQIKAIFIDYNAEKILLRSESLIALTLGIQGNSSKKIPHLDSSNINLYINEKLFIFNKGIFESLKNITNKKLTNIINYFDLTNIEIVPNKKFNYSRISFSIENLEIDKVYFKDDNENIIGYAISDNNFRLIKKNKKKFIGYYLTSLTFDNVTILY